MQSVVIIIAAYLIGNFSAAYLVARLSANIDIREHGSGNAGSTNVLRTLGLKAGILTFFGDSLKGVAAVLLGRFFGGEELSLLAGVATIVGHNWPALLKFKGGKGIATSIGVILVVHPLTALICVLFGVILLYRYRYVSLASVSAIVLVPAIIYLMIRSTEHLIFALVLAMMAVYRHKDNINRLVDGTERKIGEKSK